MVAGVDVSPPDGAPMQMSNPPHPDSPIILCLPRAVVPRGETVFKESFFLKVELRLISCTFSLSIGDLTKRQSGPPQVSLAQIEALSVSIF